MGNLCSLKGTTVDASMFNPVDITSAQEELKRYGFDEYGRQRLYNGITGEYIDTMIYMGPVFYQKLQKFVLDTLYSVANGPTDALTYQLLDGGRQSSGGLRIGEIISRWISDRRNAVLSQ